MFVMVHCGILNLGMLGRLCALLFLWVLPQGAHGSSSGSFGSTSMDGICASSVIIHGYKCQELHVTTKDGYILNLQRIPEGRFGGGAAAANSAKRPPVLIQHGILVDGMTWLLNPPEQNLPLILADNGFDVWIANSRGTRFSRRHITLDPNDPDFWDWSWDELVMHDMPAFFEYVYTQTGQKIDYVGHSLGTLIGLASFSEGLQVDKLRSAAFLSPIAYLSHMTTEIGVLVARSFVGEITSLLGLAEFNPKGQPVGHLLKVLCAHPGVDCYDLLSEITGKNCCLNSSIIDIFLRNEPQSTSTKNMIHLAQTVRNGVISRYNYERIDLNIMHYGAVLPPTYNISNIPKDIPIFISYGGQDALSDVRDVELLIDAFKFHDEDKFNVQHINDYAHADFIMGVNAKDLVYNQVVTFFKRQN